MCDDFVTFSFTQYGDYFGELLKLVRILVTKMVKNYSPKKSPRMVKNTSPKWVNIKVLHRNFLQKCHHNWWKSSGFTNLGDNSIENVLGLLYDLSYFYVSTVQEFSHGLRSRGCMAAKGLFRWSKHEIQNCQQCYIHWIVDMTLDCITQFWPRSINWHHKSFQGVESR